MKTWARIVSSTSLLLLALSLSVSLGGAAFAEESTANTTNETPQTQNSEAGSEDQKSDGNANTSALDLDIDQNAIKESQVPDSSFIYDTSLADLAEADIFYDGMTVQVVGEAVGDIINEESVGSNYKWVSLWDNSSTIVVYMSESDANLIDSLGSNHRQGTKLQVRGIFHLTCDEHNGISDLHAENVTVLEKGRATKDTFDAMEFIPGFVALALGFGLLILFNHLRNRDI